MHPPSSRIPTIDVLRAVAAILVLVQHTAEMSGAIWGGASPVDTSTWPVNLGRVGVLVFFMISGFVVPWTLRPDGGGSTAQEFFTHRIVRLFPAFLVSLAVYAIWFNWWHGAQPLTPYLAAVTMVPRVFGQPHVVGHYWTLEIEWLFYGLVLLLFFTRQIARPASLVVAVVVFQLLRMLLRPDVSPLAAENLVAPDTAGIPLDLSYLFAGAVFREWYEDRRKQRFSLLIVLAVLILPRLGQLSWALTHDSLASLRPAISHLLCVGIFFFGLGSAWICVRWAQWLGMISYSAYLYHGLAMWTMGALWERIRPQASMPSFLLYLGVVSVLTLALGTAGYYGCERPVQRWYRARRGT